MNNSVRFLSAVAHWTVCNFYPNRDLTVERQDNVSSRLPIDIPNTERICLLFTFITANLPVCTVLRISIQLTYVFSCCKGLYENDWVGAETRKGEG